MAFDEVYCILIKAPYFYSNAVSVWCKSFRITAKIKPEGTFSTFLLNISVVVHKTYLHTRTTARAEKMVFQPSASHKVQNQLKDMLGFK